MAAVEAEAGHAAAATEEQEEEVPRKESRPTERVERDERDERDEVKGAGEHSESGHDSGLALANLIDHVCGCGRINTTEFDH